MDTDVLELDVTPLAGTNDNYGSYQVLGNLTVDLGDIGSISDYKRELNLDNAIHTNSFRAGSASYEKYPFTSPSPSSMGRKPLC